MYVSLANLILVSALTYAIHRHTIEKDRQRMDEDAARDRRDNEREERRIEDERARNRPALIFLVNKDERRWYIKNATNNVALNILVSFCEQDDVWEIPVKIYSLAGMEDKQLHWKRAALKWRAVYRDIQGNMITSTCSRDDTEIEIDANGLSMFDEKTYRRYDQVSTSE